MLLPPQALLRALTTEVLRHGAITTTKVKAKAVRPWVDKIILLAKAGGEDKRRQALSWVYDAGVVNSLFEARWRRPASGAPAPLSTADSKPVARSCVLATLGTLCLREWVTRYFVATPTQCEPCAWQGVPERYAERTNDFSKMSWMKNRRGDNTEACAPCLPFSG